MSLDTLDSEAGPPTAPAAVASTEQHESAEEAIVAQPAGEQPPSHAGPDTETRPEEEPAPAPAPKAETKLCGVCQTNAPKYKCPRCRLPYCSVACNKIHRENHPPDPEPQPPQKEPEPEPAPAEQPDPVNPFRALAESEKLQLLFRKYPNLPSQLLKIHAATEAPVEVPGPKTIPASLMQGLPNKNKWNHDIGIKNGKAALREARAAAGEDGEAVREYCELVLHILNEASHEDAAAYIQRQVAEKDTELIQRLMDEEQRKR